MQQKLCLWLAVAVLFGALVAGNPFLAGSSVRLERRDAPLAPGQPVRAPLIGEPLIGKPVGQPAVGDPAIGDPAIGEVTPVADPGAAGSLRFEATPALAVALNAPSSGKLASGKLAPAEASADPLCPDRALRPLVVGVERNERGEPVWVLRDGSRCMRNPKRGAEQPLLIPFTAKSSK